MSADFLRLRVHVAWRFCAYCGGTDDPRPFAHIWQLAVWPVGTRPPSCERCGWTLALWLPALLRGAA